jgi:hypothetical protein
MYGSIFRMKVKDGKETAVATLMKEWEAKRRPVVKGAVGSFLLMPDKPGEMVGVAIFTSQTSYRANAKDPEQDKWFRKLRANLKADPEWTDGEYVWVRYQGPKSHTLALH